MAAHAHDHSHDTDTYYLDQLCMVGITGAFAGICLTLYFFNTAMLEVLLDADFHPYILGAGIALLVVVAIRATVLWKEAGTKSAAHAHGHDHGDCGHDHHHEPGPESHDHSGCGHEHHHEHADHDHGACGHDHHHEHAPAGQELPSPALTPLTLVPHTHAEGEGEGEGDGHDHGWAPWRYVVLLIPLMLYLLGLPNKTMPLTTGGTIDVTNEVTQAIRLVSLAGTPLQQAGFAAAMTLNVDDRIAPIFVDRDQVSVAKLQPGMKVWLMLVADSKVEGNKGVASVWATSGSASPPQSSATPWTDMGFIKSVNAKENTLTVVPSLGSQAETTFDLEATVYIDYKMLEQLAYNPQLKKEYDKKKVQVVGQFMPVRSTDKVFRLCRQRIQCCAADVIELNVPVYSRESVTNFAPEDWVRVTGRIEFRQQPGNARAFITVLAVNRSANVVKTNADPKPYIK